jgi:predicted DNA-binding transcriptional regulator AlpA
VLPELPSLTLAEPLLTAEDVSALLGIPRSSVYEYARRTHDPCPPSAWDDTCDFIAWRSSVG